MVRLSNFASGEEAELGLRENRVWEMYGLPLCPECRRNPILEQRHSVNHFPTIQFRVGCFPRPSDNACCSGPWNTGWHNYGSQACDCWCMTALLATGVKPT